MQLGCPDSLGMVRAARDGPSDRVGRVAARHYRALYSRVGLNENVGGMFLAKRVKRQNLHRRVRVPTC